MTHNLSHPLYLQWYGLIAQSLSSAPVDFLHSVRKLWPTPEGVIFEFPPLTEPDFLGGTRRIAVRGSKRQPYDLLWQVTIDYWDEIRHPVTQFDIDNITSQLDFLQEEIELIAPIGDISLTDSSPLPFFP